jgi:hypothetical protein
MKKLNQIILFVILLTVAFLPACKLADDEYFYKNSNFVAFGGTTDSLTVSESVGGAVQTIDVEVIRGTENLDQALTITYTVSAKYANTGNDASGTFSIIGATEPNKITIPIDRSSAKIKLRTIDNNGSDGAKRVTFTITSTSDATLNLGYPGPDGLKKSINVVIQDDDCTFDINNFLGDYSAKETGFGAYNVKVTQDNAVTNGIRIEDFYGFSSFAGFTAIVKGTFDPATGVFEIPDQPLLISTGGQLSIGGDPARVKSVNSGVFLSCTGVFQTRFRIYTTNSGDIFDENNVVYTPK